VTGEARGPAGGKMDGNEGAGRRGNKRKRSESEGKMCGAEPSE
jgi:hypothetical protein